MGAGRWRMAAALAAVTVLSGCGDGSDGGGEAVTGGYGQPGDPTKASRTIEITLADIRYEPDSVTVEAGETVTFKLVNEGSTLHEFLIGDEEAQDHHEEEMVDMDQEHMNMGDEESLRSVEPGEEKVITWQFPNEKGPGRERTVLFGCHVPGHYQAGMRGTVTIT